MKNKIFQIIQVLVCFLALTAVLNAQCDVLAINSVLLDPNDATGFNFDTDGNGSVLDADEFVEICNLSGSSIALSTVSIVDAAGNTYPLSGTLAAGSCVFVVSNWDQTVNAVPSNVLDLGVSAYINNGGDLLQLVQGGMIICEVGAGDYPCNFATADCMQFPEATDGCVNTLAEGAVDCDGTLVTEPCPDLTGLTTGMLDVGVTESTCTTVGGTPMGGLITAPANSCPMGSSLQYSLDAFATAGTTTIPVYDQSNAITVSTRCICDDDTSVISEISSVTTMPGNCPCPDLSALSADDFVFEVEESICQPDNSTLDEGTIEIEVDVCHAGSTLEFSLDAFATAGTETLPMYNQTTAITVSARCTCDNDETVFSASGGVTTAPGVCTGCPDFSGLTPGNLSIGVTESSCQADGTTVSGGLIVAAPACPEGSTLEYSLDGFATAGTGTVPTYDQTTAITVSTRCVCDVDPDDISPVTRVTTVPGTCAMVSCPDLSGIAAGDFAVVVTESTCTTVGGTPEGGTIDATTGTCPTGSTLLYSIDAFMTTGTTSVPAYNQTTAITISSRCSCDTDASMVSAMSSVTTMPGTCPPPPDCLIDNITTMPSCNADGTYTLEVCYDHENPLTADGLVDITVNGISFPMQTPTLGCVTLINAGFIGDGSAGLNVTVGDSGGLTVDCATAPDPIVYVASSYRGEVGDPCDDTGEYVTICATEGCVGCPEVSVDLAGWEIEDFVSNDGSPETSINIVSGALMPGECFTIYSHILTATTNSIVAGTEGSSFEIFSDRMTGSTECQIWNNSTDDIYLYDGDSQGAGTLIDVEGYSSEGVVTYETPSLTGCSTGASSCEASVTFSAPACCQPPVATAIATCTNGTDEAAEGFYYIEVVITDLGTNTDGNDDLLVSVNGGTAVAFSATGTYYLGPIAHSGSGTVPAAVNFQNSGESCSLDLLVGEVICGYSTAAGMSSDGTADTELHASGPACDCDEFSPGFLLAQVAPGSYNAATSVMVYILVDAAGNLVTYNQTGLFTSLGNQSYSVFPYNIANIDFGMFISSIPVPGTDFSTFTVPDGCNASCGSATFALDCDCAVDCGTLACNDAINITVDENCEVSGIRIDNLLEGAYGDPDNYTITITAPDGTVVDYLVETSTTSDDVFNFVGQPLTYMVSCEGNNCWGQVTLEDKTPPTLECDCPEGGEDLDGDGTVDGYAPECILSCYGVAELEGSDNLPSDLADFVANSIEDNCQNYVVRNVFFEDELTDGSMCTSNVLKRTWTVEFESSNGGTETVSCVREYLFQPITVVEEHAPDDPASNTLYRPVLTVNINCLSTDISPTGVAAQLGDDHGFPHIFVNDQPVGVGSDGLCNIMATYDDTTTEGCAPGCNNNGKIIRRWTVLNWCDSGIAEYHQIIKLTDDTGPALSVGTDIDTTTAPNKCGLDVGLPAPAVLADFCGGASSYQVTGTSNGNPIVGNEQNGFAAYDLPVGTTEVYYVAEDCCGNQSFDTITVTIKDRVAPNAIAEEFIVVPMTLLPDGKAWAQVQASSVDNGSFDSCSEVILEIRRSANHCEATDSSFGPSVSFCCADMESSGFADVLVDLRVTDDCGNTSVVTATVILQDNTTDALTCPVGMVVGCLDEINDLTVTGLPSKTGICGAVALDLDPAQILADTRPSQKSAAADPQYDIDGDGTPDAIPAFEDECGFGAMRRDFRENGSIICTQYFVFVPDTFNPNSISWPRDVTVGCSTYTPEEPTFNRTNCGSFGVSVESDTFATTDGSCYRIINNWSVVDWCTYRRTDGAEGIYSEQQEVTIIDNSDPVIAVLSATDFDLTGDDCTLDNLTLSFAATDADMCPTELLDWVIEVDYNNDGSVDVTRNMNCFPGDTLDLNLSSIPATKSGHSVSFSATDGCGNTGTNSSVFRVNDVTPPLPYCVNLSTSVGDTGAFELWAIDFNGAATDNCTADSDIRFTFSDVLPPATAGYYDPVDGSVATLADFMAGTADSWDPVLRSSGRRFTDMDLDSTSRLNLRVYFWDECGNRDFCIVTPVITDPNGPSSSGSITIQGVFMTEQGHTIQDVAAEVMTDLPDYPTMMMTDAEGEYAFANNPANRSYAITGEKNDDPLNGVSTLDLILLQAHIIGSQVLDTPYELIAADINNDRAVDGIDIIELRKLILGIYDELPQNTSWKFVDESQVLTMADSWIYKEKVEIHNASSDMESENFVGIKVGDLDGDVVPNAFDQATALRSNSSLSFKYENAFVSGGEVFVLELSTENDALYGYQLSLDMTQVELLDVSGKGLTEQNYHLDDTQLVISYNGGFAHENKESVMTLKLKARKDGWIDGLIQLNTSMARAEAYVTRGFEVRDLSLSPYDGFELKQNVPNPFSDYTVIEYSLPQSGEVTLTLFDVAGRELKVIEAYGQRGQNVMEISKAAIGQSGVIYYKLDSAERTAMKRMMLLE